MKPMPLRMKAMYLSGLMLVCVGILLVKYFATLSPEVQLAGEIALFVLGLFTLVLGIINAFIERRAGN